MFISILIVVIGIFNLSDPTFSSGDSTEEMVITNTIIDMKTFDGSGKYFRKQNYDEIDNRLKSLKEIDQYKIKIEELLGKLKKVQQEEKIDEKKSKEETAELEKEMRELQKEEKKVSVY